MASIDEVKVGDIVCVKDFGATESNYRRRLMALGLTKGTQFEVIRFAPLGCPIQISVRGFNLSLRKNEAKHLTLEIV